MATRRMFSKKITDTDDFLDMPLSAQCLYFHINMGADDDGFVGNVKTIRRMIGASEDDLKLLFHKEFLFAFEGGVVVIRDWKIHNYIRSDRYKETIYQKEKRALKENESGQYQQLQPVYTNGIPLVYQMDTQVRLGKDRIVKDRITPLYPPMGEVVEVSAKKRARKPKTPLLDERFITFWEAYPKKKSKQQAIKAWQKLSVDDKLLTTMLEAIKLAKTTPQWQKDGGQYIPHPATWLNAGAWEDEHDIKPQTAADRLESMKDW